MKTETQIKNYLVRNKSATIDELSRSLRLTKAAIHYHIRNLISTGEIRTLSVKHHQGAGRPARQFEITEIPPLPLTRLLVSHLIIEAAKNASNSRNYGYLSDRIAERIVFSCPVSNKIALSPTIKLKAFSTELKEIGFDLRWQAGKTGPQLQFDREPLTLLIEDADLVNNILESMTKLLLKETA